jgi:hypothetical protein
MKGDKFHFAQNNNRLVQFATGMNGDEDLGEDITMKGDKFHFYQNVQLEGDGPDTSIKYDTKGYGPNGGVEKLSFFDPKITKAHTSFSLSQAEPPKYDTKGYGPNGGVEKLSFFDPKITKAHTSFSLSQAEPEAAKKAAAYAEPEKV